MDRSPARDPELRRELLGLAAEDRRLRSELAATGELWPGYHPRMEALHRANAERLTVILAERGWPDAALVGPDGAEAAWLVAQHAIGDPRLQRRALDALLLAADRGTVPRWQLAFLEDRIRSLEGRQQRYGTQFDWDDTGELSPVPSIEDPSRVDDRRRELGLEPLAEAVRRHREAARRDGEQPPANPAARRREMEAWARRVGWRAGDPTGR